jgi:hypothetical protein
MPTGAEIFATTNEHLSEVFVHGLAVDLSEALGTDCLIEPWSRGVILEPERDFHLLPDALPRAGSIVSVHLSTAYYGKGYERGYWPDIAATLEFLRRRVPLARVWYGHDSDGEVWEVTREFLDGIWDYWAAHGSRPYFRRSHGTASYDGS